MKENSTIYVGLSGGVDSAVTLALLIQQSYNTKAIFMRNWSKDLPGFQCPWREDWHDAQSVALSLSAKIELWDFEKDYKDKVVDYLISEYRAGRTPNPDIICNQEIKFKVFLERAIELGADKIATGHYARTHQDEKGRFWLQTAKDASKDQSYFLARISQEALSKTVFPLGDLEKTEVRKLAAKLNLPVADKKDSVGICFVGEIGITDFLKNYLELKPGPIIDINTGAELGQHEGSELYTIGQRHGLHINPSPSQGEGRVRVKNNNPPYYVIKKDTSKNIVYVSSDPTEKNAITNQIILQDIHFPTIKPEELSKFKNLSLRTRHLGKLEEIEQIIPLPRRACPELVEGEGLGEGLSYQIKLKEDIKKPASGQTGVVYTKEGYVLTTGFIE